MTTFDKREEGFEKQFAHDEELKFKAMARRNKLLGLWAAEKLGVSGPAADAYAKRLLGLESMKAWYAAGIKETIRDLPHESEMLQMGTVLQDLRAR